jgi:ribosomal protein S18 acetylase RimI-like enzyme
MDFTYILEELHSDSLNLEYHLVPWDTEILGYPVAEIKHISLSDTNGASVQYKQFQGWCRERDIRFCNCRVQHAQVDESLFLQNQGFRFIELNYNPVLRDLRSMQLPDDSITVLRAEVSDQSALVEMAGQVFKHGRFHQDPQLGPELGNKRYAIWMANSFSHPGQVVYKCVDDKDIIAFFVVEYPGADRCHWSLIGLAPEFTGRGFGTRVWQRMMRFHQLEGMNSITTSISSHNTPVFNLYIKLGFRFPIPKATFHWSR